MTGTTTSYAGRQLDIELLQHVAVPVNQRVYPALDHSYDGSGPRICAGMEKVVQRYAKLLLTDLGSMRFDQDVGGEIVSMVRSGRASSTVVVSALFSSANRRVLMAMKTDDADTDRFGTIPDDERISGADLVDVSVDESSATIRLRIRITTEAGTVYEYIAPVASGI